MIFQTGAISVKSTSRDRLGRDHSLQTTLTICRLLESKQLEATDMWVLFKALIMQGGIFILAFNMSPMPFGQIHGNNCNLLICY